MIGIGSCLNERFVLRKELGRGGMGAVYRATDELLDRNVAIKVLLDRDSGDKASGDLVAQIRIEARILARLVHENIVRIYDLGQADDRVYLVMEEVEGPSFFNRWRELAIPERVRVLAEVADALDYAHHQGVIHRDLKPGNILLTPADRAKLSDFGLSLLIEEQRSQHSGMARGTPLYMSPEQARGKRIDHRSDIYALGVLLYECTTGQPPFSGAPMAIMAQHVNELPEPVRSRAPATDPELAALIMQMLAKKPAERPATGAEVVLRLRAALQATAQADADQEAASRTMVTPSVTTSTGTESFPGHAPDQDESSPTVIPGPPLVKDPPHDADLQDRVAEDPTRRRVDAMLAAIHEAPVRISPDQRFLIGHYLAYLLGGSRRFGFLRRRPLDPLNADRARYLLAMTWLTLTPGSDEDIAEAAKLIADRFDVRPRLDPTVVIKYLIARSTEDGRQRVRDLRDRLLEASPYAQAHLTNDRGILNPGLIPRVLGDLRRVAPARVELDDELIQRWNGITEIWRGSMNFRDAVLRYATTGASRDPATVDLWPEVVYPLIERARWQQRMRSRPEQIWDDFCDNLTFQPAAGRRLNHAFRTEIPQPVADEIEAVAAHNGFADVESRDDEPALSQEFESRTSSEDALDPQSIREIIDDRREESGPVRLVEPDPVRIAHGQLHQIWKSAVEAMKQRNTTGTAGAARTASVGPYRLVAVPTIRARASSQIVLQSPGTKRIEMLLPPLRAGAKSKRVLMAIWLYEDQSAAVAYLDYRNSPCFIAWHAPTRRQFALDDPDELLANLRQLGLEQPGQVDRVLTSKYRPIGVSAES